jgi:hypothetical protein
VFILAQQRDLDVVAAFAAYRNYLALNRQRFPPSAFELASSDWYFNPEDHRCPHDSRLETAVVSEGMTGAGRSCALTIRLRGAYDDGHLELRYPQVYSNANDTHNALKGHGDWRFDELRAASVTGRVIHEIEWASNIDTARWIIEASDVLHAWVPGGDA